MSPPSDVVLTSAGITLTFSWTEDRYQHRLISAEGELHSLDNHGWETPIFTDLHRQDDLLFLSGQSHDRHWSMSVEPTPEGWLLDVACRAKSEVDQIGTYYEAQQQGTLRIVPDVAAEAPPARACAADGELVVEPERPVAAPPMTIRYRYRIATHES